MPNGAKNYCFTLNNPTPEEYAHFAALPTEATWMVVGKEVGESGTPHLQGIVCFIKRRSLTQAKAILSDRAHFEVARDVVASIKYCRKDGDFYELGSVPERPSERRRSDLEAFKDSVKSGLLAVSDLRESHSEVFAKYPRFCFDYIRQYAPKRSIKTFPLHPWQQELVDLLTTEPDDRTIVFIVDEQGNAGKSWFCDWYAQEHKRTQVMNPGKKADMAYALETDIRVLFLDAPRSKQGEYIQYDFLEDVKNGRVFSGKYESGMKHLNNVHIVVMMNEQPDMNKLSADRYVIISP